MKVYREPMFGIGVRYMHGTLCVWFACWVMVWKPKGAAHAE